MRRKTKADNEKGFTLIELSIVLVIIGLIVGGVLTGNALIEAAKLRQVGGDYEKYNTAVMTFKLKYNCLPGDCLQASSLGLGTSGDGDRVIDYDNSTNTPLENFYFWRHLSNADLVNGSYSGTSLASCVGGNYCYVPGSNVPKGSFNGSLITFFYIPALATWSQLIQTHVMALSSIDDEYSSPTWLGRWHHAALTTQQMQNLDQKYDDGYPFAGNIVDLIGTTYSPGCTISETLVTTTYNLSNTDKRCILLWKAQF